MATYQELFALQVNDVLREKVAVAAVIAAQAKLAGTPTASEAAWAVKVIENPTEEAKKVLRLVLAANESLDVGVISAASDAAVQLAVDNVVAGLVIGA